MFPVYALFKPGSRPSFSSDFPVNNGDFLLPGLMGTTGIVAAKPSCAVRQTVEYGRASSGYVRSSSGSCKNENVMNMINQYSPLVFGATRFRSDPCRVLSTIPVGMIENDGDVSTSVSPDCY